MTILTMTWILAIVLVVGMLTGNRPNDVFSKQPPKWIDEETQQW